MAVSSGRKRPRRSVRKSGSRINRARGSKRQPPTSGPRRPRRTPFQDVWDTFLDDFAQQMTAALSSTRNEKKASSSKAAKKNQISPYDEPSSIIKRMAYKFIFEHRRLSGSTIPNAISNFRLDVEDAKSPKDYVHIRRIRKPFENNEFHWVLMGIKSALSQKLFLGKNLYSLETWQISRYAIQLKYALRHEVPPHYLIGFIYQSGPASLISSKEKNKKFENWYRKL